MGIIVTLIIVGLLLLGVEILFIPGVGIAGILGVVSFIASAYLAWVDFGMATGLVVAAVNLLLLIVLLILALRAKMWKRFELKTNIESKVEPFKEGEIPAGTTGKTTTRLAPMGTVLFGSRSLECKSLEGMIDAGTEVEVVMVEDNHICVRRVSGNN